jgi:cyclopropane-fatty-acyl-phospholipid synthase
MTSSILAETSRSRAQRKSFGLLTRSARSLVAGRLTSMQGAELTIEDALGTQRFGTAEALGALRPISARVDVHDGRLYKRMLTQGQLGAASSFLDGHWSSPHLTEVFRAFVRADEARTRAAGGLASVGRALSRVGHALRSNTRRGSRRNIQDHYDLGNELFELFLDETMSYSCLVFDGPDTTLEEAARAKLDRVCNALELDESDHLLEIGTGWGGLAMHAAEHYGCRVTTTTISPAQHELATARIREAGLEAHIDVRLEDYRELHQGLGSQRFDKVVAIEMLEAVGREYLGEFFAATQRLLKPGGTLFLQVITMPGRRYKNYLRSPDFIQRYVFPGSHCPSLGAILSAAAESSDYELTWLDDIGLHYAETLRRWRERFFARLDQVRELGYPERFVRLWDYYLCYCEAGFEERFIGDHHLLFRRPGAHVAAQVISR